MSKYLGNLYEQKFILECLERRLHPFRAIEEGLPQDFMVMNNRGQFRRVQVKGTSVVDYRGAKCRYKVQASTGSKTKSKINCEEVDVLACYVAPLSIWYIVPCPAITSVGMWLYPTYDSQGKYEIYKDLWQILS